MSRQVEKEKQALREKIWKMLAEKGVARFPFPLEDRIPNYAGSERAAARLRELPEWRAARVIYANPDYAQKKAREYALLDGKLLIMATPRLRDGFIAIDPKRVKGKESQAATISGAFRYGENIGWDLPPGDLKIVGSVAVTRNGHRLGKGGGFGDREIAEIRKRSPRLLVVTTVHELQIVDRVPLEAHDEPIDIIVTPEAAYRTR